MNRSKTAFDKHSATISTFSSPGRFNYSTLAGYYSGYAAEGSVLKFRVKFAVEAQDFLHSKKQKGIKAITQCSCIDKCLIYKL